ncbi:MAG: winged helix-turn-helix transcriptional regulator [Bacteroidales bacterium]|nr:winged helix-turn-helix transcriptional regulator [Bacteroidales bacterium]
MLNKPGKSAVAPVCESTALHRDVLLRVQQGLTDDEILRWVSSLFKVLGDPSRLKIVNALLLSEMCVCDLASLLDMSQSAISHQLQILRQSDLVKWRRDGKVIYYSLDDEHVNNLFYQGLVHVNEKHHHGN